MTFKFTEAYRRDWKLRQQLRYNPRPSNAKNRCADCRVEVCKGATRCSHCSARNAPSRRKA